MRLYSLINESTTNVSKGELRLLNYLNSNDIPLSSSKKIFNVLVNELEIENIELIAKIIKLYKNNPIEEYGDYSEISNWVLPDENSYSDHVMVLAKYLKVDPIFLEFKSKLGIYRYEYIIDDVTFNVGTSDELKFEIKKYILHNLETGYRSRSLNKFIKLDGEKLDYNIKEIISEELNTVDLEYLLDYFGMEDYSEDLELLDELKEDLKASRRKINNLLKTIDKLESEKTILNQEIQDSEDDDDKLNSYISKVETKLAEASDEYNKLLAHIYDLDSDIEKLEDRTPLEKALIDRYISIRTDDLYRSYERDPVDYAYDCDLSVIEALDEGLMELDLNGVIEYSFNKVIEDNDTELLVFNGQEFYIMLQNLDAMI